MLHQKGCGQKVEGCDSFSAFMRSYQEYCTQFWGPQYRKDIDLLEQVPRKAMKMISGLEHLSYEESLREPGGGGLAWRRENIEETLLWPSNK